MSGIGGVRATQEVMDLCAKHDIKPDIKVVQPNQLTEVYQMLDARNDGGERFVIDISSMTRAFESGDDSGLANDVAPDLAPNRSSLNAFGILREIFRLVAGFGSGDECDNRTDDFHALSREDRHTRPVARRASSARAANHRAFVVVHVSRVFTFVARVVRRVDAKTRGNERARSRGDERTRRARGRRVFRGEPARGRD